MKYIVIIFVFISSTQLIRSAIVQELGGCPSENYTVCGSFCCLQEGQIEFCYAKASQCLLKPHNIFPIDRYAVAVNAYSGMHVCSVNYGAFYQCSDQGHICCGDSLCCKPSTYCLDIRNSYHCYQQWEIAMVVIFCVIIVCVLAYCLYKKFWKRKWKAQPITPIENAVLLRYQTQTLDSVRQVSQQIQMVSQELPQQEKYVPEDNSNSLMIKSYRSEIQNVEKIPSTLIISQIQSYLQDKNNELNENQNEYQNQNDNETESENENENEKEKEI